MCGLIRNRRPGRQEAYSLEYVEDFFWLSTTQMAAVRSPQ